MNKVKDNIENIYELTPLQKGMLSNNLNSINNADYYVQYEIQFNYLIDKKIQKSVQSVYLIGMKFSEHPLLLQRAWV